MFEFWPKFDFSNWWSFLILMSVCSFLQNSLYRGVQRAPFEYCPFKVWPYNLPFSKRALFEVRNYHLVSLLFCLMCLGQNWKHESACARKIFNLNVANFQNVFTHITLLRHVFKQHTILDIRISIQSQKFSATSITNDCMPSIRNTQNIRRHGKIRQK